jgi:hypothetical protein
MAEAVLEILCAAKLKLLKANALVSDSLCGFRPAPEWNFKSLLKYYIRMVICLLSRKKLN